ncbi:uncharacterized protein HRG_04523 [Hirsutella rhossiliensis]|uniref:Uncharacterized protein n=1 Tax=Hirsutella rhossiliensis TaxID=111463 RepID=A0A9P8MZG2_9HYPO|nr:uncharacterized protein HRG_04523 [Hirsutella rhossiliensis]KAH0964095.1 hypothetical protein HRG_04523 [Hirsutella rhossiliensis]
MFGSRRHAPPVQPLTRETANPNAATAAASAFGRRGSNASLSSAAAAAALRARPVTPTNVAEVQTKRTHRRSPSLSSQASRDRDLQRTPSVSSMAERTFRSPSPGPSPAPRDANVPPVPSLPIDVHHLAADHKTNGGQRKPAALQTQPFRTASEKMKHGQHGSWFGGATAGDPANVRRSDSVSQSAAAVQEPRPGSVSPSINFSYPRARVPSPAASIDDQTPVYDANSRRMVPRSELLARSQSMHEPTEKPKKKKAPSLEHPQPLPVGQKPSVASEPQATIASEQSREPTTQKKKKKKKKQPGSPKPVVIGEQATSRDTGSSADNTQPSLSKKPSVVNEEPELEARAPPETQQPAPQPLTTTVPTDQGPQGIAAAGQARGPEAIRPGSGARFAREPSESPARSARFAPAPDQLLVRHEPPPRSVSPKKSAMKLSSQRDASPSDDDSETSERRQSPHGQDDAAMARKKSARVSWDDKNTVVVGESVQPHDTESPFVPSPQAKKPWHSIVTKYAKKESVNLSEDETMSPRPALPLFGSVREKKPRDYEERPLVRPSERTWSPSAAGPSETSLGTELGQSSDAAVGAALAQDQASRNAANISKYREPLPASMPPGESSAKESTFVESSSDDDLDTDTRTDEEPGAILDVGEPVPTISISLPSPGLEKPKRSDYRSGQPEVPGRFPEDDDSSDGNRSPDIDTPAEATSQDTVTSTPSRSVETPSVVSNAAMEDIEEEEEESDRYSIYSDAYEDLDEVDGDGFLSLDAVVESSADGKTPTESREQVATGLLGDAQKPNDWENAKAYWKSLSADQRRLLEVEALSDDSDDEEDDMPRRVKEDGKRQTATGHSQETSQPPRGLNERNYQIMPGTKWTNDASSDRRTSAPAGQSGTASKAVPKIRHSMRSEQPGSARTVNEQPGGMRKSMRGSAPAPAAALAGDVKGPQRPEMDTNAATDRPASYHPPETIKSHKARKRNLSVEDLGSRGNMKPSLGRRGSDDSVSSFTRSRASPGAALGFRRSMRSSLQEPSPPGATKASGRFSLRSMSPPAFRRNSISSLPGTPTTMSGGGGRMRHSLRSEATSTSPKTRLSPFKRSPGGKKGGKGKGGSRFADSSDEDEGGPSFFSSRFVDSSDDEDIPRPQPRGKGLAKSMRGANRSASRLASSAVLDRNGDAAQPKRATLGVEQASSLHRSGSGRGTLTPLPAAPQGEAAARPRPRRGSIMSILRRKKDPPKISRDVGESAARRDTRLERSPDTLSVVRSNSHHKRGPSWPLPDGEGGEGAADDEQRQGLAADKTRPSTAGGPVGNSRTKAMAFHRRNTSLGTSALGALGADLGGDDGGADSEQTGADVPLQQQKKKKFGALRKMFGIHN